MNQHHQIPTFDPATQRPQAPSHLEVVINAIDRRVDFEIGGNPGSPPHRFELQPGQQAMLPRNYCLPIQGANPAVPRPSVLSGLTSCSPWPDGPQIQAVVPLAKYEETARAWAEAKRNQPRVATVMLTDTRGNPQTLAIPTQRAAAAAEEDDGPYQIEEPPPGVPDLRTSPPAPAAPEPPPAAVRTVGKGKA